jgi:hypothetical protein
MNLYRLTIQFKLEVVGNRLHIRAPRRFLADGPTAQMRPLRGLIRQPAPNAKNMGFLREVHPSHLISHKFKTAREPVA